MSDSPAQTQPQTEVQPTPEEKKETHVEPVPAETSEPKKLVRLFLYICLIIFFLL